MGWVAMSGTVPSGHTIMRQGAREASSTTRGMRCMLPVGGDGGWGGPRTADVFRGPGGAELRAELFGD